MVCFSVEGRCLAHAFDFLSIFMFCDVNISLLIVVGWGSPDGLSLCGIHAL